MGPRFKDIMDKAKPYIKKNILTLYRAYCLENGDEIVLHSDGELLFFDYNGAINNLLNRETVDPNKRILTMLEFDFDVKENRDNELGVDHSDDDTGSIAIVIDNLKLHAMRAVDYMVNSIEIEIDPKTEIKTVVKYEMDRI